MALQDGTVACIFLGRSGEIAKNCLCFRTLDVRGFGVLCGTLIYDARRISKACAERTHISMAFFRVPLCQRRKL